MRTSGTLLAFVGVAAALPGMSINARSANEWVAPGPNDSRAPCPGLNTLANHGFLPHNGRNISMSTVVAAGAAGLNIEPNFLGAIVAVAFGQLGQQTINLEDLNRHGVTEHEASLSRDDASAGNSLTVNMDRFDTVLADSEDADYIDVPSLVKSRVRLQGLSDPLTQAHVEQALLEAGLLILLGGGVQTGEEDMLSLTSPKDIIRYFFENERLPYELGWSKSPVPIQGAWLQEIAGAIGAGMAEEA